MSFFILEIIFELNLWIGLNIFPYFAGQNKFVVQFIFAFQKLLKKLIILKNKSIKNKIIKSIWKK
jgi:hypothetical protein